MSFRVKRKDGLSTVTEYQKKIWYKAVVKPSEVDSIEIVDRLGKVHCLDERKFNKNDIVGVFYHKVGILVMGKRGLHNKKLIEEEGGVVLKDGSIYAMNVDVKTGRKLLRSENVNDTSLNLDMHPIDKTKIKSLK